VTAPDPREERLPRWARDRINTLRFRLTEAQRSRDEARLSRGPAEATDTWIDPYATEGPITLPKGERIRFVIKHPEPGRVERDWVDVSVREQSYRDGSTDRWVEVMGGATLALRPSSSNVIQIRVNQ
jgi:hypothetical protein